MRRGFVYAAAALTAFFLPQGFALQPVYGATEDTGNPHIVLVADVSGSMADMDPSGSLKDALSLVVGLAPEGAEMALLSVNTGVRAEMEFYDTSSAEGRRLLRSAADSLAYQGNTDLVHGLQHAVEKLDGHGRIILLADISEGGLTPADTARASGQAALAEELAARCASSGITVDLILMGQALEGNALAAAIEGTANKTGGRILRAESGPALPRCVEELYFSSYTYLIWPVTGAAAQSRAISLRMPTNGVNRARVYAPGSDVKAAYAGAGLETESCPAFTLLDLSRPAREGISLTAEPEGGGAEIYLIADYGLEAAVTAASEIVAPEKKGGEAIQAATLTIDILDKATGGSILDEAAAPLFTPELVLTPPEGESLSLQAEAVGGKYAAAFHTDSFGTYTVTVTLAQGNNILPAVSAPFEVADIRPVKASRRLSVLAAVIIGGLLITGALVFACRRRNGKTARRTGAIRLNHINCHFAGKLFIRTVLAEGGAREIPPFIFHLEKAGPERRITLKEIYDSSGIPVHFKGIEDILFLAGPESGIVVKNNADAQIRVAGREYGKGQAAEMYYDGKLWIRLVPDVDEIEVVYRRARATGEAAGRIYFRSARRLR